VKVATHLQYNISTVRSQGLDLLPCPKVMIHAVDFPGARRATTEQHHLLNPLAQLGRELDERLAEFPTPEGPQRMTRRPFSSMLTFASH
jgi:hypothetical protein